jgi:iron complex outermembrane recepter protein
MRKRILIVTLLAGSLSQWVYAQQGPANSPDLSSMTIEALMDLRVTSVSRRSEPLSRAAAAITVITQEDIRRSGATSIPELLRMVPGLDVAQMDASTWAVSARGFNAQYAGFMLVLLDGRTVYDLTSNGVYWDVQDTLLEDIARIEVIRGPGAVLWGLNAVNGVVNIITKQASETQGGLLTTVLGSQETPVVAARYGGPAGASGHYRAFVRYFDRQPQATDSGYHSSDGWHNLRSGFRADWELLPRDTLTVLGGGYRGLERHTETKILSLAPPLTQPIPVRERIAGADILTRWRHTFSDRSELTLQTYFDYTARLDYTRAELRKTADFDLQHRIAVKSRHELIWGLHFRYTANHTSGSPLAISFNPRVHINNLPSWFVQDEITLLPERLRLVLGLRYDYAGDDHLELLQPDARLLWSPRPNQSLWLAFTQPISDPSFAARSVRFSQTAFAGPGGIPAVVVIMGNPKLDDSQARSFQAGYRRQLGRILTLSAEGFYTRYTGTPSTESGASFLETDPAPAHLVLPLVVQSSVEGETHGLELSTTWQAASRWKLATSYTWLDMSLRHVLTGSAGAALTVGSNPQHQFQIRSYLNLPRRWEWDTSVYSVGRLPSIGVPAYVRLDTRLGWRLAERAEISLVGQNLLRARHSEFGSLISTIETTQIKRSGYAKLTWTF